MENEEDREERPRGTHESRIAVLEAKVRMISWLLKNNFVTKHEFTPAKMLLYGLVALVMSSVIAGVLALVFKKI